MKDGLTRRQVMNAGVAVGLGALSARFGHAESVVPQPTNEPGKVSTKPETEFSNYSRFRPSFGGPPGSDQFLGKLVPGLRQSGLEPVMVEAPDLEKVPWKMVNGVKEFELRCTPVKREFP